MRSVRLDPEIEARLAAAAKIAGQSVSGFIREAVLERCDRLLGERLDRRLADVVGIVSSDGGRAERSGAAFADALAARDNGRRP